MKVREFRDGAPRGFLGVSQRETRVVEVPDEQVSKGSKPCTDALSDWHVASREELATDVSHA